LKTHKFDMAIFFIFLFFDYHYSVYCDILPIFELP